MKQNRAQHIEMPQGITIMHGWLYSHRKTCAEGQSQAMGDTTRLLQNKSIQERVQTAESVAPQRDANKSVKEDSG